MEKKNGRLNGNCGGHVAVRRDYGFPRLGVSLCRENIQGPLYFSKMPLYQNPGVAFVQGTENAHHVAFLSQARMSKKKDA